MTIFAKRFFREKFQKKKKAVRREQIVPPTAITIPWNNYTVLASGKKAPSLKLISDTEHRTLQSYSKQE